MTEYFDERKNMTEEELAELFQRIDKACETFTGMIHELQTSRHSADPEFSHLVGKIEGLRLAQDYLRSVRA